MAHYAKVVDNVVVEVIVAESEFINNLVDSSPGEWIQTSYNTINGKHKDNKTPLRKNFAGIGYTYNKEKDAFIPPKIDDSWVLDEDTCTWKAPTSPPDDKKLYVWDTSKSDWKETK